MTVAPLPTLLLVGEILVEIMRQEPGVPLARPAPFLGPFPSGAPAIVASTAARLGVRTEFAGRVGNDVFGDALLERLRRHGVRTSACRRTPDYPTGTAFVAYDHRGGREFVFNVARSAAGQLTSGDLGELPERAGWLHVSGSSLSLGGGLSDAVMTAARRVARAGGVISLDPNIRATDGGPRALEELRWLARAATVLFPSEGELAAIGVEEADLVRGGVTVCTTYGARGAHLATPEAAFDVAAPAVSEIDPTGAGDTFAGTYIAAVLSGSSALQAATFACRLAAQAVEVMGPMEVQVPTGWLERQRAHT